jgi:hypothetical protein
MPSNVAAGALNVARQTFQLSYLISQITLIPARSVPTILLAHGWVVKTF